MRKISSHLEVSIDGVIEAPETWAHPYFVDEMAAAAQGGMNAAWAVLFGRKTYEEFAAYWPYQDPATAPFAGFLNETLKIVVSNTMTSPPWGPAEVISGDVVEAISALKRAPGGDLIVLGSPSLLSLLLRARLLDSVELFVYPVVLGRGKRLFEGSEQVPMTCTGSKTFSNGVLQLRYEPAGA